MLVSDCDTPALASLRCTSCTIAASWPAFWVQYPVIVVIARAKSDGGGAEATAAVTWLPSRTECSHHAQTRQNRPKKTSMTLIEISRSEVYSDRAAAARAGAGPAAGRNRGRGGCP